MQLLFIFLIWMGMGSLAAYIARERGRDPAIWFFLALFLGMLGLILLFLLPSKKSVKEEEKIAPPPCVEDPLPPASPYPFWYYLDQDNKSYGPMSFQALQTAMKEGKISSKTYIWNEEMDNWKTYEEAFS